MKKKILPSQIEENFLKGAYEYAMREEAEATVELTHKHKLGVSDAIQKAMEEGWKPRDFIKNHVLNIGIRCIILDSPFEDPLFWQALGKAEAGKALWLLKSDWLNHWHDFIDHLAEGKEIDLFFKELLK